MTWDDLTRRSRSRPDTTIAYGDDRMQKVDVWRPAGAGPFKTVLMVHGGCWQTAVADRSLMDWIAADLRDARSEEHTSELQSLMRNSYAVFCSQKKNKNHTNN